MNPSGSSIVAGHKVKGSGSSWTASRPSSGEALEPPYRGISSRQLEDAVEAARSAVDENEYSRSTSALLARRIADLLELNAEPLIERADMESALGHPRLEGELARTSYQFRLMAEHIESPQQDPQVDDDPEPLVRAAVPLGVVAVFAASNFPLAFGVGGTDTASALAAGCSVVAKAHPAQPATAEIVGTIISEAISDIGLDAGLFSVIHESGFERGLELTTHPDVDAVAFTGSRSGGMALVRAAQSRNRPIPVYAEMGSFNPVIVTEAAARERGTEIAEQLISSYQLGGGQFCTKPGLVLLPDSAAGHGMRDAFVTQLSQAPGCALLTEKIASTFEKGIQRLVEMTGTEVFRSPATDSSTAPAVVQATPQTLATGGSLLEELFGPVTIIGLVSPEEADAVLSKLEPALATTIYFEPEDGEVVRSLIGTLSRISGRVIANGPPTGVRVSSAMHHGGPFPAASSPLHTSVGTAAVQRFLRPVALQGFDAGLLPGWARMHESSSQGA